jgi:Zn finger protein HypA/HybF involved in hydrogenase expression
LNIALEPTRNSLRSFFAPVLARGSPQALEMEMPMEDQYWEWECLACESKYRTPAASETIPCPTCDSQHVTRLIVVSDKGKGPG